jgi:hypothetical protein
MANLEVDADRLSQEGEQFNNIASIAYSIYGFLMKADSLIDIPEDDPISKSFAEQWHPLMSGAKNLLLGFRDGMSGTGDNIDNTAMLYKQSNIVNSDSIGPAPITDG